MITAPRRLRFFASSLLLGLAATALAGPNDYPKDERPFLERREQGWFWYEEMQEPVEEPEPAEPPPPETAKAPEPSEEPQEPAAPPGPPPLSTAWLQENMPKYLNRAMDDPTPENIRAYEILKKIAVDKATVYATQASLIIPGDPLLDENRRRAISSFGAKAHDAAAAEASELAIKKIAETAGLFFFFRSDCPFCHTIAPIVKILEDKSGVSVIPISIDGKAMPNGLFQDHLTDNGQATKLSVTTVPTLFLVAPDGRIARVGEGVMSLTKIKRQMIQTAYREGILPEADYNATKPYNADIPYLSEIVDATNLDTIHQDDDGLIPSQKIIELVEGQY